MTRERFWRDNRHDNRKRPASALRAVCFWRFGLGLARPCGYAISARVVNPLALRVAARDEKPGPVRERVGRSVLITDLAHYALGVARVHRFQIERCIALGRLPKVAGYPVAP